MDLLKDYLHQVRHLKKISGVSFEDIVSYLLDQDVNFFVVDHPASRPAGSNVYFRDSYIVSEQGYSLVCRRFGSHHPGKNSSFFQAYYKGRKHHMYKRDGKLLVKRIRVAPKRVKFRKHISLQDLIHHYRT